MTRRAAAGAVLPRRPAHWDRKTGPAPRDDISQDVQRDRRRNRLSVHYGARFDLGTEVAEIVCPLARELSKLPRPEALRRQVDRVADGVADVVHVAAALLAESRATDDKARRLAADLAVRPRMPEITDESLVSGSWGCVLLVDYAGQLGVALSALLDRALPPEAAELRGNPSASDRLVAALRILDRAAADLGRLIPKAAERQGLPSMDEYNRAQQDRQDAERASAALARFGVGAV